MTNAARYQETLEALVAAVGFLLRSTHVDTCISLSLFMFVCLFVCLYISSCVHLFLFKVLHFFNSILVFVFFLTKQDVAARGLDLPSTDWIVQYNPPVSAEDYVHRVGRTARIGQCGQAMIFLSPPETGFVHRLAKRGIRFE